MGEDNIVYEREKKMAIITSCVKVNIRTLLSKRLTNATIFTDLLIESPVVLEFSQLPLYLQDEYGDTEASRYIWIDSYRLKELVESPPSSLGADTQLALVRLLDVCLFIVTVPNHPQYICWKDLQWDNLCTDVTLDASLHLHTQLGAYFSPLPTVNNPIIKLLTKHGIKQRCIIRDPVKKTRTGLITRRLEESGRGKKQQVQHYEGYIFRLCKQLMLCALLGNYKHCDPSTRPSLHTRKRLYELFTQPVYERWIVRLIQQSVYLLTNSIRTFICYSIKHNLPLYDNVHDILHYDKLMENTERTMGFVRQYFEQHLCRPNSGSDLYHSFDRLPARPCFLQHFWMCELIYCQMPCTHKFLSLKQIKAMQKEHKRLKRLKKKKNKKNKRSIEDNSDNEEEEPEDEEDEEEEPLEESQEPEESIDADDEDSDDSFERTVLLEMDAENWVSNAANRTEEIEREKQDTQAEISSGWKWSRSLFHRDLNTVLVVNEEIMKDAMYERDHVIEHYMLRGVLKKLPFIPVLSTETPSLQEGEIRVKLETLEEKEIIRMERLAIANDTSRSREDRAMMLAALDDNQRFDRDNRQAQRAMDRDNEFEGLGLVTAAAASESSSKKPRKNGPLYVFARDVPNPFLCVSQMNALCDIVDHCMPVNHGIAMPRIVQFFCPYLAVDEETVAQVQEMLLWFYTKSRTLQSIIDIMKRFYYYKPHTYNLIHITSHLLQVAQRRLRLMITPRHIREAQVEGIQQVYSIPKGCLLQRVASLVYCGVCGHIYSHIQDSNSAYRNVFRYGLRDASIDLHNHLYCNRDRTNGKVRCGDFPLIEILLIGRMALFQRRLFTLCPQEGCGRLMCFDHKNESYMFYNAKGFACHHCTQSLRNRVQQYKEIADTFKDGNPSFRCCMPPKDLNDKQHQLNHKWKLGDVFLYPNGVFLCKEHQNPHSLKAIEQLTHSVQYMVSSAPIQQQLVVSTLQEGWEKYNEEQLKQHEQDKQDRKRKRAAAKRWNGRTAKRRRYLLPQTPFTIT